MRVDEGLGICVTQRGVTAVLVELFTEAAVVVGGRERRRHGVGPQPARWPDLDERLAHVELALALGRLGDEAVGPDGEADDRLVPVEPGELVGPLGPSRGEVRCQERADDQRADRGQTEVVLVSALHEPGDEPDCGESDEQEGQPDGGDPGEPGEKHQGAEQDARRSVETTRDDGTRHQREKDNPATGEHPDGGPLRHEIHHAFLLLLVGVFRDRLAGGCRRRGWSWDGRRASAPCPWHRCSPS